MCVGVNVYIYVYIYLCVYLYVHMCVYIYILSSCLHSCKYIYICIYVSLFTYTCIYTNTPVYLYTHVYVYVYVHVYTNVNISMCTFVYVIHTLCIKASEKHNDASHTTVALAVEKASKSPWTNFTPLVSTVFADPIPPCICACVACARVACAGGFRLLGVWRGMCVCVFSTVLADPIPDCICACVASIWDFLGFWLGRYVYLCGVVRFNTRNICYRVAVICWLSMLLGVF